MTLSSNECDLLVVGGGPGGSTAGTFVARFVICREGASGVGSALP
jgi:flavin-dependent dehydrogenase